MNNNTQKIQHNYIIPFAKPTGVTSFKSMHSVKKIVGTKKIGHTGTLDLFADGLLVLLSGQYTRFADLISTGTKEYRAWVEFGKQTETLDPEGEFCLEKALPSYENLANAVKFFLGKQDQIPPKFSAIKIKGKRASDRIRAGEKLKMSPRSIEIFSIEINQVITDEGRKILHESKPEEKNKDEKIHFAEISVHCSKGTYIRSLAHDIAEKVGSCAYLRALRRTAVGNFKLEDAVGYSQLQDFSSLAKNFTNEINTKTIDFTEGLVNKSDKPLERLKNKRNCLAKEFSNELFEKAKKFTPNLAKVLNIEICKLNEKYLFAFEHGKPIRKDWFTTLEETSGNQKSEEKNLKLKENKAIAVFYNDKCVGLITKTSKNDFKYQLVFN